MCIYICMNMHTYMYVHTYKIFNIYNICEATTTTSKWCQQQNDLKDILPIKPICYLIAYRTAKILLNNMY